VGAIASCSGGTRNDTPLRRKGPDFLDGLAQLLVDGNKPALKSRNAVRMARDVHLFSAAVSCRQGAPEKLSLARVLPVGGLRGVKLVDVPA
jgi:hypothetical protein